MKKFLLCFALSQALLLFPIVQTATAACTFSSSGTSNGECYNIDYTYSCNGKDGDQTVSCGGSYGGCDWGDVTVFYQTSTCE
ncbi:MAG: hypothetical protein M3405_07035 [Acidobacteriota bacterium]|jgi:hypothetical protein|nr:hypothetical protein [Acidobacteriota bacterium]